MNLKAVRNALMAVIALGAASLEAPKLAASYFAHEPLAAAASGIAAAPNALTNATATIVASVRPSHLGFDTNIYPGDGAMDAWRTSGEYEWVGYYLKGACHSDGSWSGNRARLTDSGWGLAVIYVGQQTWGKRLDAMTTTKVTTIKQTNSKHSRRITRTMTRNSSVPVATASEGCSASYVNAAQGRIDARDAIAKTTREGFARGTTVFLDIEPMNRSVPQRMRDYYRAWTQTVINDGTYRPGIYAHTKNAASIFDDVSDVFDDAGVTGDPAFWIAGSRGFSPEKLPADVGHTFATAWQGVLDVVRTHNGVKLPVDISVASVASPSAVQ
jgi:hypothetical protein